MSTTLFEQHEATLTKAIKAVNRRTYFAHFPEYPNSYPPEAAKEGFERYQNQQNQPFVLAQTNTQQQFIVAQEISPYTQQALNISYPSNTVQQFIVQAETAFKQWRNVPLKVKTGILLEALNKASKRFHEVAYAHQHTTGQGYGMSFQMGGTHAAERALETLAMGYQELKRFPAEVRWQKGMGRYTNTLHKTFHAVARGIGLLIAGATLPTWNSLPAIMANLLSGNVCIVKPHPNVVLPLAIYVQSIQEVLQQQGYLPDVVQLAVDTPQQLLSRSLAEHPKVKIIDYTGNSIFGNYLEHLASASKIVFTQKSAVNSVIFDSVRDLRTVMRNLAFSVCLYSGQLCAAPQNFFIPKGGIPEADGNIVPFEEAVALLKNEIDALVLHPQRGAGVLGAIQNTATYQQAKSIRQLGKPVLAGVRAKSKLFKQARMCAPSILKLSSEDKAIFEKEYLGPTIMAIATENTQQSVQLAKALATEKGAISCAAYSTDKAISQYIINEMNEIFTPVSLNFTGFTFVNQHEAYSDFHVTGGNPSGNASTASPSYINKRFVWLGNRIAI